mgnify:CR=1 FL=1|tara:strand:+ start:5869 stop:7563 length:1695 start_codon:yes stop_codon:yes gene_type:complete
MKKYIHPSELTKEFDSNSFKGMKITFVNMPLRESAAPNVPPEGPAILAAICRMYGAEPYILDLNAYRIKDELADNQGLPNGRYLTLRECEDLILRHLSLEGDQDVIAFSGMITTLKWQEEIAKIVRKHLPDTFIVSGNGLATEIRRGLFKWIPELDAIARSEGDDVILAILKDARAIRESGARNAHNQGKLSKYCLGEIDGMIRFQYDGDRPKDLNAIPYPEFSLLESDPYGHNILEDYINIPVWGLAANNSSATSFNMKRSLTSVSSRGCPYACAFCYRGAQGERNYGMRSSEHIAKQIREYVDHYDLDFIGFPDDNFAVDKRRIKRMVPVFKEYGLDEVRWGTHTRMDEADARLEPMAESGCVYIGFGAESASDRVLKFMNKGGFILRNGMETIKVNGTNYDFPKTMTNAIRNCHETGIHPNCTWIMGYPGEELSDLKTSVAFILWQQEYWSSFHPKGTEEHKNALAAVNRKMFTATAYPGTAMWDAVHPHLEKYFDIKFDVLGKPVCDDNFHQYVLELDDATKVLNSNSGEMVNFSDMPLDTFLEAREHVDNDEIEKILEM